MSTAIANPYEMHVWAREPRHTMQTLRHTWVCTQVNCNGVNHVWRAK